MGVSNKYSEAENEIINRYTNVEDGIDTVNANFFHRVEALATAKGVSMAQISVAWMLSKDEVAAPIVGVTNLNNLEDLVGMLFLAWLSSLQC